MSPFALLKPAGVLAGALAVAAGLSACGSSHHTASPPPPSVATTRRAPAPTTTAPLRRVRPTTTTTAPATTATTEPATTSTSAPPTSASTTTATTATTATTTATTLAPATSATTAPPPTSPPLTTAPSAPVRVIADCQNPSYEPPTIILSCSGGGITATRIQWTSWGATSATGSAVIVAVLCNPTCAQGSSGTFPASVTLSGVTAAGSSGQVFSTLTANFSGASPSGTPTETYSLGGVS